jgi:hypothetical protein
MALGDYRELAAQQVMTEELANGLQNFFLQNHRPR